MPLLFFEQTHKNKFRTALLSFSNDIPFWMFYYTKKHNKLIHYFCVMGNIATTIEEQIHLLKNRGMNIEDEAKAKEHLLDIGYYRLGFYWFPFEKETDNECRTHQFLPNTHFNTVIDLYYLDVDLRNLLTQFIHRIEINFRTKLIYYVSNEYKNTPTWFVNPKVIKSDFIESFDKYYNDNFKKKNKVIDNHHKRNINDRYAPAWKTLEYFTFGTNLKIFKSLINKELKEIISKCYGVNDVSKFIKIMDMIVFVRNYCAHSGVMFDLRNTYGIPKLPFYEFNSNDRHCLDSCIKVITFILRNISDNRAFELEERLAKLLTKYSEKDLIIKDIIENKINYKF